MTTVVVPASAEVGVKSISVGLVLMYTQLASSLPLELYTCISLKIVDLKALDNASLRCYAINMTLT